MTKTVIPMIISPSIASANPLQLEAEIRKLDTNTYTDLHIDIEDGNFIPNITFGLSTIKAIRKITELPFSFHLMVSTPKDYLDQILTLQPSIIFAHVEALQYPLDFLESVQRLGARAGLAFNPKTPIEPYLYALRYANGILVMTSEPDGIGQQFIPEMVEKAAKVKELSSLSEIWADGGITHARLGRLSQAGVTHVVMGREIFRKNGL